MGTRQAYQCYDLHGPSLEDLRPTGRTLTHTCSVSLLCTWVVDAGRVAGALVVFVDRDLVADGFEVLRQGFLLGVTLPRIAASLGTGLAELQGIVSAFNVAFAAAVIVGRSVAGAGCAAVFVGATSLLSANLRTPDPRTEARSARLGNGPRNAASRMWLRPPDGHGRPRSHQLPPGRGIRHSGRSHELPSPRKRGGRHSSVRRRHLRADHGPPPQPGTRLPHRRRPESSTRRIRHGSYHTFLRQPPSAQSSPSLAVHSSCVGRPPRPPPIARSTQPAAPLLTSSGAVLDGSR